MALRDQPYIPLYVQDYLTDEKLNECSAATQGIYIKIMCLMHKSDKYGYILLKQKDKQTPNQIKNFASKLVKHLPFEKGEIENALTELLEEEVLHMEGDKIYQKRMVKDNELSLKRSIAGKKGGDKNKFALANSQANNKAKTEDENEDENENENEYKNEDESENEKKDNTQNVNLDGKINIDPPKINKTETAKKIVDIYNEVCVNLPKVLKLTPQRIIVVNARVKDYSLSDVGKVIQNVADSKFLNGENDRGWKADFDWIFKSSNFIKILENRYKNNTNETQADRDKELFGSVIQDIFAGNK